MKLFAVVFVLFSAAFARAQVSQELPYYGEQFYQELASGVSNEALKTSIKKVLRSYHVKSNNGPDQIVNNCAGQEGCYAHISLGYDRARIFMMGVYYLQDRGNNTYAIHDVDCDTDKTTADFIHGTPPGPRVIPDGNILNTEHTWPQSKFSGRFDKNMQKSDLHHLFPADNEMNSVRGNNAFGEVVKDKKTLKCPVSRYGTPAGGGADVFEPPKDHRGNVARALFYFSVRYELPIDGKQEAALRKWNQEDPIDDEEIARNNAIQGAQGNRNPFVDYPELVDRITDF